MPNKKQLKTLQDFYNMNIKGVVEVIKKNEKTKINRELEP